MRIRVHVYALAALAASLLPATVLAAAVQATVSPSTDVAAGSTVQVRCYAEGRNASGMTGPEAMQSIDVTVSDGTVSPSQIPGPSVTTTTCPATGLASCNVIEGSVSFATPTTPATLTATCTANYLGGFTGTTPMTISGAVTLTTVAAATLPPVVSAPTGPSQVVAGTSSLYAVSASDPNTPPLPLTYAWAASGGVVTPDPADPAAASWQAPAAPGSYEVSVTVSNGATSVVSRKTVVVVLAAYQASLPLPFVAPRRLAAGEGGRVFVVDGRQGSGGEVGLLTARGEVRGFAVLPEPARAAVQGAGFLWVATAGGNVFKVDPVTGRTVGRLALSDGPFAGPSGMAYDPSRMTLWVADATAGRVRVVRLDGTTVANLVAAGGAPLRGAVDVAVDPASGRAWVLLLGARRESELVAGEPIAAARFLHAFDLDAGYLGSYVSQGSAAGQISRAGGLAVGPGGRLYVSDVFQGTVKVLQQDGASVGTIGAFGEGDGQLTNPTGLAFLSNGDVVVANTTLGRVDRFGTGAALPTCAGDADCDGLPDAWENAFGLDANWAGDALLDLDGEGLSNFEEHAHGTNPGSVDTDGDGHSDRDELLAGFDPNDPNDHRPAVSASGPAETTPGLVRLSAAAAGPGTCSLAWTQAAGPKVTLRSASGGAPSFVAREAGTYAFDAVATCGGVHSAPGRVRVVVKNVPPLADAGRVVVASPGSAIRLDALASSDANGDALGFVWDQTLGPAVFGAEAGGTVTARPRGAGLYAFQVTVEDGKGAASIAEVPVLVAGGPAPTALAAALPAEAEAGSTVLLDASASLAEPGSSFAWQQVAGAPVALSAEGEAVASFVPAAAGRYAFEVTVGHGRLRSPPARVEVFVAAAGGALPSVTATAPSIVAVGAPVSLEATLGAGAQVTWRQVSGPAAGLTDGDLPTATVVPFAPGFHVFEASVSDGVAEGHPARVAFEARSGGRAIPQARIATPAGDAWVGQLVFLDGRASTGAARYRWTQVAGPWVALGAPSAVTTFRPLAPGRYAFELEVDDGATRSAPARVEVNVVSQEGVR